MCCPVPRPLNLTGDGVDGVQPLLDGVHGDLRSEAKCQAQPCLGKRTGKSVAALPTGKVTRPASPGRYLAEKAAIADRDLTMPKTGEVLLGSDLHALDDIAFGNRVPVARGSADNRVLTVKVGVPPEGDEKLARTGVAAGECHTHRERIEGARGRLAAERL